MYFKAPKNFTAFRFFFFFFNNIYNKFPTKKQEHIIKISIWKNSLEHINYHAAYNRIFKTVLLNLVELLYNINFIRELSIFIYDKKIEIVWPSTDSQRESYITEHRTYRNIFSSFSKNYLIVHFKCIKVTLILLKFRLHSKLYNCNKRDE